MSTSTIHPSPELPVPRDPWAEAEQAAHNTSRPLSDQEFNQLFEGIVSNYDKDSAPHSPAAETAYKPRHHWTPERDYTPTPAAEIARRNAAGLMATYALAHTLRDTNPELLQDLRATEEKARPQKYRGRHRR